MLRWKQRPPTLQKSSRATFSSCKHLCFWLVLVAGCLNWIKHAHTCHCPLDPSLVSLGPVVSVTSRLLLKTSRSGLSSLSGLGGFGQRPRAGTWDDNYTVLSLSGCDAEPSAHTIIQKWEGGGVPEEGSVIRPGALSWFCAKLLQDMQGREISRSSSF